MRVFQHNWIIKGEFSIIQRGTADMQTPSTTHQKSTMAFTVDSLMASSSPISRPPLAFPSFGSFLPPPSHASVLQNGLLHHHQSTVPFSMNIRNSIPLVSSTAAALMPGADSIGCAAVFSSAAAASLPTSLSTSAGYPFHHSHPGLRTHQYSPPHPHPPTAPPTSQHPRDLLESGSISPTADTTSVDDIEPTTEIASSPGKLINSFLFPFYSLNCLFFSVMCNLTFNKQNNSVHCFFAQIHQKNRFIIC